ncbi:MAG: DUF4330 family protein [Eubacteriales bacterium]|nr:DUF4330 family protein [Eubacteriales bacterium]
MKKFNVIDAIILLVIVVAVALVGTVKLSGVGAGTEADTKIITLELAEKREDFAENVIVGDKVSDKIMNTVIGEVVDVKTRPCEKNGYNQETGAAVLVKVPERVDVFVTMEVDADAEIYVGKSLSVRTKHFAGSGYVVDVSEKDAE